MLREKVLAPAFIGRAQELAELLRLLDRACAGRGGLVLVGGDAGVGKTRLCRELKTEAALREVRVIEGRSSPGESAVPYGPFLDALRFRLARGEGEAAVHVLEPVMAHVAPLFRELTEATTGGSDRPPRAVSVPYAPILEVIRRLARLGPALFLLEDVHWADATSRELLHYIAPRITDVPVLMVVTYRTDELHAGHPVHRMVASLTRARLARRYDLEPLSPAEVSAMLSAMLGTPPDAAFATRVHERTDGNPLYVEELVSALAQLRPGRYPRYSVDDLASAAPPATIHELVLARLEPLGPDALVALTAAAVVGRRFHFDVLLRALDWPEERLLAVLEEAVARGLLDEHHDEFAFRHSLVQEVLYTGTIGRRRRLWHRRVAAAMERLARDAALPHTTLAHHYREGGDMRRARDHAVLAGDEAASLCAWREAERMYEAALAALEQVGLDTALEAELLERMAEVAWWQNRIDHAEQYADDALALRRALGAPRGIAAVLRRLANIYAGQRGDHERAFAALHEALELLEATDDDAERALVVNDLGRLCYARGDYAAAERWHERGLLLAQQRRDCGEEALALVLLGRLAIMQARIGTGVNRLELARALLAEGPVAVDRAAEVFHAGIRALDAAREHERAREWAETAIAYAATHHMPIDLAVFRAWRAAVDRRAGRWKEALRIASSAVKLLRNAERAELREALRIIGDLYRVHGDFAASRHAYEEAAELGESDAHVGLALVRLAEGRAAEAADELTRLHSERMPPGGLWALRVLPLIVEAEVRAGRLNRARRALNALESGVRAADYRAGSAAVAHAAGLLHAAEGDHEHADRLLRSAIAGWAALGLPYERARAMLDLAGALLVAEPGGAAGVALARDAAEALAALGAAADVDRARSLLRSVGVRVQRRTSNARPAPPPVNRLSQREREVLVQLTRGLTNKQIARTLSIRPKTVGNHVSSILAKLGCTTRTQATRIALEAWDNARDTARDTARGTARDTARGTARGTAR